MIQSKKIKITGTSILAFALLASVNVHASYISDQYHENVSVEDQGAIESAANDLAFYGANPAVAGANVIISKQLNYLQGKVIEFEKSAKSDPISSPIYYWMGGDLQKFKAYLRLKVRAFNKDSKNMNRAEITEMATGIPSYFKTLTD